MNTQAPKTIVLFGSAKAPADSDAYQQAYAVGRLLAEEGFVLANGGYGGTMAASARAAAEHRGESAHTPTIGVTCRAFGRGRANPWIDKEIVTQDLYERLDTLIGLGDGYIALPGGSGTLLEIAAVWELINKQFLAERPIIFLSDFWKPVMDTLVRAGQARPACLAIADDIEQVRSCLRRWFAPDRTAPANTKPVDTGPADAESTDTGLADAGPGER